MAQVFNNALQDEIPSSDTESNSSYMRSPVSGAMSDQEDQTLSASQYLSISRPLSRSSVTSGLSVTATKDGVEGKRVKRRGIPGYPLNLIEKMYANYLTRSGDQSISDNESLDTPQDDKVSVESLKSVSMSSMIPQYSAPGSPSSLMEHEVYGEHTVEFEKESTDYEKFLQRGSTSKSRHSGVPASEDSDQARSL